MLAHGSAAALLQPTVSSLRQSGFVVTAYVKPNGTTAILEDVLRDTALSEGLVIAPGDRSDEDKVATIETMAHRLAREQHVPVVLFLHGLQALGVPYIKEIGGEVDF